MAAAGAPHAVRDPDTRAAPVARWDADRLPVVLDAAVAVGLLVALSAAAPPGTGPAWLAPALPVALTLPLAVRRRWPRAVFAVVALAAVGSVAVGMGRLPFLAAAYAAYAVAVSRPARRWTRGHGYLAVLGAVPLLAGTQAPTSSWIDAVLIGPVVVGAAWVVGRVVRERGLLAAQAAQRLAERAVTAERLHIARELHDVVAHSISVIAVKAGVANHVLAARPQEAADALRVIEGASREVLTELRHLLGVLRREDDAPAELGPTPGLAALPALATQAERAGVRVELDLPRATALPDGVDLSAYRIVQEALTNVIKHAGPVRCRIEVRVEADRVRIAVTDTGPATAAPPVPGHGLIGMRERVAVYGGAFHAGPEPGGGFAVRAELPLAGSRR
ncbi:sensor histidine kinase [Pseudonocardia humida]|uniref:histidine kinase n=1 Tax=Pseudonocardia humida TaxID=2800819 RepID=A0ABT0ZVU7_9PSEU|nr:sensor histidine kinase [Pseudonocardia humida]MCO1654871.1 sensor histidine kinase [Pseudonocardia humida]